MLLNRTQRITYTAALTAIACVMLTAAHFLPFSSVLPMLVAALLLYYNIVKCGIVMGVISALITGGVGYFAAPTVVIAYALMFAPYAVIAYFLDKVKLPSKAGVMAVRYAVLIVFFNLSLWLVYYLSSSLFGMADIVAKLWGLYPLFAAIMSVLFVMCDYAFRYLYGQLVRRKIFK